MEGLGLMNSLFAKSDITLNETPVSNIDYKKDVKKPFIEILNENMIITKNNENSGDIKTIFEKLKNKSKIDNVNEISEENINNITNKIKAQFEKANLDEKNVLIENRDGKLENISNLKEKISIINSKIEIEELNSSIIDSVENIAINLENIDLSNEKLNNLEINLEKIYEKYSKEEEKIDEFINTTVLVQIGKALNLIEKYIENEVKNSCDLDTGINNLETAESTEIPIVNTKNKLENFLNKVENYKRIINSKITESYKNIINSEEYALLVKENISSNIQFLNSENISENNYENIETTENSNEINKTNKVINTDNDKLLKSDINNTTIIKNSKENIELDKIVNIDDKNLIILEKIKEEISHLKEFVSKIEEDVILLDNINEAPTPNKNYEKNIDFTNKIQPNKKLEKESVYSDNTKVNFQEDNNVKIIKTEKKLEKIKENKVVHEELPEKQALNKNEIIENNLLKNKIVRDNSSDTVIKNNIITSSNESFSELENTGNIVPKDNISKKEELSNFKEVKYEKNSNENRVTSIINNEITDVEDKTDVEKTGRNIDISNKIGEFLVENDLNGKVEIISNDINSKIGLRVERDVLKREITNGDIYNEDISAVSKDEDMIDTENIIQLNGANNEIETKNSNIIENENYSEEKNILNNEYGVKTEKKEINTEKNGLEEKKYIESSNINNENRINLENVNIKENFKKNNLINESKLNTVLLERANKNEEMVIENVNNDELINEIPKDIAASIHNPTEKKSTKETNKLSIKNYNKIKNNHETTLTNSENKLNGDYSLEDNGIEKKISFEKDNLDSIDNVKFEEEATINENLTNEIELIEEKDNKFNEFLSTNSKYGLKKVEKKEQDVNSVELNSLEKEIKLESETSPLSFVDKMPKRYSAEILNQVKNGINIDFSNLKKEMKIKLTPEELGEVEVKLSLEKNIMKAEFLVQNEKVKEILETRFNELRNNLIDKGIENPEINVNIFSDSNKENHEKFTMNGETKETRRKKVDTKIIETSEKITKNQKTYKIDSKTVNILY